MSRYIIRNVTKTVMEFKPIHRYQIRYNIHLIMLTTVGNPYNLMEVLLYNNDYHRLVHKIATT